MMLFVLIVLIVNLIIMIGGLIGVCKRKDMPSVVLGTIITLANIVSIMFVLFQMSPQG